MFVPVVEAVVATFVTDGMSCIDCGNNGGSSHLPEDTIYISLEEKFTPAESFALLKGTHDFPRTTGDANSSTSPQPFWDTPIA